MKEFDRKFGPEFLERVPDLPGTYRFFDDAGAVIYVGKSKSLKRRLNQYRNARRLKRDRKMKKIVKAAARLTWEAAESELDAELAELRSIQELKPKLNVAGAYAFLYPLIGMRRVARDLSHHSATTELYFCFTTTPAVFADYSFHGAYRSREVAGLAFFSLMRVLQYVGHAIPRRELGADAGRDYSYVFAFRRLPENWSAAWEGFFRGETVAALEDLVLRMLDNAGARAKAAEVQEGIRALRKFFEQEARPLYEAVASTGHGYPVGQSERDPLFVRYRKERR